MPDMLVIHNYCYVIHTEWLHMHDTHVCTFSCMATAYTPYTEYIILSIKMCKGDSMTSISRMCDR